MTMPSLLSVVVPIKRNQPDLETLHTIYRNALEAPGRDLQFIYVVDGPLEAALASLRTLKRRGEPIEILHHAHSFGEASALNTGFRHAKGELIMTLPEEIAVKPA